MIIKPEYIDAFVIMEGRVVKSTCAYKGCSRRGRIKLFWREESQRDQNKDFICVQHAVDLANRVLEVYKFERG